MNTLKSPFYYLLISIHKSQKFRDFSFDWMDFSVSPRKIAGSCRARCQKIKHSHSQKMESPQLPQPGESSAWRGFNLRGFWRPASCTRYIKLIPLAVQVSIHMSIKCYNIFHSEMQPLSERHNSTKRDHATFNNNLKGINKNCQRTWDIMTKTFKVTCLWLPKKVFSVWFTIRSNSPL